MFSDVFVASYVEDPDQLSWMVIDSWDNDTQTLKFSFEMHFVRNAFSVGQEDLTPPTVSLTNGYFDAFHLRE
ncbi:hypothetical protein CEQ90_11440 [Lewinellaceae bacterium SD302]|nr:hypothetical protein CEQ90_11440 [Lewinellaceae bacterium SD302]